MSRWWIAGWGAVVVGVLAGCGDETPTSVEEALLPIEPQTVEIALPWSDFGVDLQVLGGFARTAELPGPVVAKGWDGALEARVLGRFGVYPDFIEAVDSMGATVTDTAYTIAGGRIIAVFDTTGLLGNIGMRAGRLQHEWDWRTATWDMAVDSLGDHRAWDEPGAGPAPLAGTQAWEPMEGDSVKIEIDQEAARAWGDTADATRGVRLEFESEGQFVNLLSMTLEVDTHTTIDPDTVVTFTAPTDLVTVIYSPSPAAPTGQIRVGGAPAWRSVLRVAIPKTVDGPPSLCERVGCPYTLDPARLNIATLDLTTRTPEAGFLPRDTVLLDARAVLAPDRLPKAPLGSSLLGGGFPVLPDLFGPEAGATVSLPVTGFVRDFLRGETASGDEAPTSLALLSFDEPHSILLASFAGPGEEGEPILRLILTTSDTVEIR